MSTKVNKSEQMRELFREGWNVVEIAQLMNVRYQYVYNVIKWYVQETTMKEVHAHVGATVDNSIHMDR